MKRINHIPSPSSPSFTLTPFTSTSPHTHCTYFTVLSLYLLYSKGFLNVSPLWIYFTLVHPTPSIALAYPFTSHPHLSTAFNAYSYILYLHRCYVLQYYWSSLLMFSFPSFLQFRSLVPQLQTCSMYEFIYDHACFVYMFIFWIYLPCIREKVAFVFLRLAYFT
jgi:hypothetical protein